MPTDVPDWVTLTDDETVVWRGGPALAWIARDLLGEVCHLHRLGTSP